MKVHIHCLLSIPTSFHKPCGEWCGEKQKGLTAGSCKPLKYMVGRAGIEPATLCLEGMSAEQVAEAAVNRRVGMQ